MPNGQIDHADSAVSWSADQLVSDGKGEAVVALLNTQQAYDKADAKRL